MSELSNARVRQLKAAAQRLNPIAKVGKSGLSAEFIKYLDDALGKHELIKVRFDDFKEEKRELSAQIAEKTHSHLVWIVGHVAVFYRELPKETPVAVTPAS